MYSDLAIELCLTLGMVFQQPLRQTQGLIHSIAKLLAVEIVVPHFLTLSRRSDGLSLSARTASRNTNSVDLVLESTGLKMFRAGEWNEAKHKSKRKLHLSLDLIGGEIVCADLTTDDVGDPTAFPGLLDQVDGPVHSFLADRAYDGSSSRSLLVERFGTEVEVTVPPPKKASFSLSAALRPTVRDRQMIEKRQYGRMAWQKLQTTINVAGVKLSWAAGKPLLGPS